MKKIPCKKSELNLLYSLMGGQCFRWHKTDEEKWTGIFAHRVWTLSQDADFLYYEVFGSPISDRPTVNSSEEERKTRKTERKRKGCSAAKSMKLSSMGETVSKKDPQKYHIDTLTSSESDAENDRLLRNYFRLDDLLLEDYYKVWSQNDPHFQEAAVKFQGVRILAQDPVENLFSFICSSNNNISRISSMVEKLCTQYGKKLMDINGTSYHEFPEVVNLTHPSVEDNLRKLGFGYRAKFIHQSACMIEKLGGSDWLYKLRSLPYAQAKAELIQLPGIGAKVADCICLMSLNHLESIPVDTHIFQVAVQRYLPHLKNCKSVTDKVYNEIGDYFRKLYGNYAGWAHTVIFCADLKMFQANSTPESSNKLKARKRKIPS